MDKIYDNAIKELNEHNRNVRNEISYQDMYERNNSNQERTGPIVKDNEIKKFFRNYLETINKDKSNEKFIDGNNTTYTWDVILDNILTKKKKRDKAEADSQQNNMEKYLSMFGGSSKRKNYDKCTVSELKAKASKKKIKGSSKMTKQELINALRKK